MKTSRVQFYLISSSTLIIYLVLIMCGRKSIGAFTGALTISFLFYTVAWFIFDKWFWKNKSFLKWFGIEDLSGYWEGNLYSSYDGGLEKKTNVEIKQSFSEIVVTTKTDQIESFSFFSVWEKESTNKKKETFLYV